MLKKYLCFFALMASLSSFALGKEGKLFQKFENPWHGFMPRVSLGAVFDFESEFDKGVGTQRPSSAQIMYGIEYGFNFAERFFASFGLDWTIVYPRNFEELDNGFFKQNVVLWYIPITNLSLGYSPSEDWLLTLGMSYVQALSFSARYKVKEFMFIETRGIVWMDRIFDTKGTFGQGYDNLHWSAGVGFFL